MIHSTLLCIISFSLHHDGDEEVYAKDEGNGLYVEEAKNGVYKLRRDERRKRNSMMWMRLTKLHCLHHEGGNDEGEGMQKVYIQEAKNGVYKLHGNVCAKDEGNRKKKLYIEEAKNWRGCNIQTSSSTTKIDEREKLKQDLSKTGVQATQK